MNLKDLLTAPRYGIYLPETQITTDVEYTGYGSSFRLSTSLELGDDDTFSKVKETLDEYLEQSQVYLEEKDLGLLRVLLDSAATVTSKIIAFGEDGITLASLITVNAKKVQFIYEKYNSFEYALQLSLTNQSSIKFAWSDSKLEGDFYFNIKRSFDKDVTSITGYTSFHLGNDKGAKPVTMRAGMVNRKAIRKQDDETQTTNKQPQVIANEDYTYIQLKSRSYEGITIADIARMITPDTVDMPEWLDNVAIDDFVVFRKEVTSGDDKTNTLAIMLDCHININDNLLSTKLTIFSETSKDNKTTFGFEGIVTLDGHRFRFKFKKGGNNWAIIATYDSGQKAKEINFKNLVGQLFGDEAKNNAPDVKINIKNFKAFFYYDKQGSDSKVLFGMGAEINIDLKSLPMAGQILVDANALAFKDVLVIYAKGDFNPLELKEIKALGKDYKYRAGFSVCANVVADGKSTYYTFGGSEPKAQQLLDTAESKQSIADEVASKVTWSKIDKKIGPVNLQRIGLAYKEGKIIALLDASIATKALELQLMGLGVGFNLDWDKINPDFYLNGLGLSYKTGAVEISGAFLRGKQEAIETYSGAARIKMKGFTISAIGSYAKVNDEASLFIYGLFQGNIGGDPAFYVTGIAAGFGYNRKLNVPEIDKVADFPLVKLVMTPEIGAKTGVSNLATILKELETVDSVTGKAPIEIASGNYWFALGVQFNTYKLLESFALITVNFGTKIEFNILGLSRMSFPEKSIREITKLEAPVIYIELALKLSYTLGCEVIKVEGLITPGSYIMHKDCKLTGGFAFYVWVAGEHAGDFVMTIGGYHPRFPKPDHYPVVPRVALNWQLNENLYIRGELYFALTPSGIMMGGRWELAFVSSNIEASFLMWIDMLMLWAPFYYDLQIGILIRVDAHIKLKLITIHLHIELRALLDIWGPPFSGKAEIDLGIYSFEIHFGSKTPAERKSLQWDEFANGFLPKNKPSEDKGYGAAPGSSEGEVDCISVNLNKGVISCIEEQGKASFSIANPMQMELVIDSSIPVVSLQLNDRESELRNNAETLAILGVRPCGFNSTEVSFEMEVNIKLGGKLVDNFQTEKVSKGFPDALWGGGVAPLAKEPSAPKVIQDVMSGLKLKAMTPKLNVSQEYDFSTFIESSTTNGATKMPQMEAVEQFNTREGYNQKNDLLKELMAMGFNEEDMIGATINEHIYSQGGNYFRAIPKMGSIGHDYHNPTDTE
jgi:hypothetical protein